MLCLGCDELYPSTDIDLSTLPPRCEKCNGLLKPDFIFFGEGIPDEPQKRSQQETKESDLFLVIGTTGEIMPASLIPQIAKQNGATIIEINTEPSSYTNGITDIFLQGKATEMMNRIINELDN